MRRHLHAVPDQGGYYDITMPVYLRPELPRGVDVSEVIGDISEILGMPKPSINLDRCVHARSVLGEQNTQTSVATWLDQSDQSNQTTRQVEFSRQVFTNRRLLGFKSSESIVNEFYADIEGSRLTALLFYMHLMRRRADESKEKKSARSKVDENPVKQLFAMHISVPDTLTPGLPDVGARVGLHKTMVFECGIAWQDKQGLVTLASDGADIPSLVGGFARLLAEVDLGDYSDGVLKQIFGGTPDQVERAIKMAGRPSVEPRLAAIAVREGLPVNT